MRRLKPPTALALYCAAGACFSTCYTLGYHHVTYWAALPVGTLGIVLSVLAYRQDMRAGRTDNQARQHLETAATDEQWEAHLPGDERARPTHVIIHGTEYAVKPLTLPTIREFMEAGQPIMDVHVPVIPGLGQMPTADQIVAANEAMYAQLATLLVDAPDIEELGLYVPLPRCQALLALLGPNG